MYREASLALKNNLYKDLYCLPAFFEIKSVVIEFNISGLKNATQRPFHI